MYKGHKDKDNEGGTECGRWGRGGWRRVMGGNEETVTEQQLIKKMHLPDFGLFPLQGKRL